MCEGKKQLIEKERQDNVITQTPDGTFSMTRLIMVISIIMAVTTWGISFWFTVSRDVFDFIFKLVALSVTQYTATKIKDVADKKLNGDPKEQYTQEVK